MERKGIRDLMERKSFKPSHLQKSLIESEIPGRWEGKNGLQNVYNLINGSIVPRDSYVFVFLSESLETDVTEVLMRFTEKEVDNEDGINW